MERFTPDEVFAPSSNLISAALFDQPTPGEVISASALPLGATHVRMNLQQVYMKRIGEIGRGEIAIVSVITDGVSQEPVRLQIGAFENVKRKSYLQLGPGGVTLYRNQSAQIPAYIDYRIMIVELDDDVRNIGNVIAEVYDSTQYKAFRNSLLAVTSFTAPQIALITAASDFVLNLTANLLKANKDDQLFYLAGSYDKVFDALGTKYGSVTRENKSVRLSYQVEAQ